LQPFRHGNSLRAIDAQVGVGDQALGVKLVEALLHYVVVPVAKRLQILDTPHAIMITLMGYDVVDALSQRCPTDGLAAYAQRIHATVAASEPVPSGRVPLLVRTAALGVVVAAAIVCAVDWWANGHRETLPESEPGLYLKCWRHVSRAA
jgi:hypothetical protein